MTVQDGGRRYRLGRAAPTVPVSDLDAALRFYVGVLGMAETFRNGDPTRIVVLERDDAEVHLAVDPSHRGGRTNVLHLIVDDAAALHAHVRAQGVDVVSELRDADYGMRTFVMADPDGNRIDVGQEL